jgi:hypothetical protein
MKYLLTVLILSSLNVFATESRLKAWDIHNRITGVPPMPSSNVLNEMEARINQFPGQRGLEEAADIAIESRYFYEVRLKNWFKPFTNRERAKTEDLNDMVATLIGAVRDSDIPGKPFTRALYDDLVYVGPSMGNQNYNFRRTSNDHYRQMELSQINLKDNLVERMQSQVIQTENSIQDDNRRDVVNILAGGRNGSAGVFSSRAGGMAFFSAGTNRRMTRYAFMNFMCKDFEDLHDTVVPDFRVRRDVPRNPGGDSRIYKNTCVGCHAGQDALGGAWAHYDYRSNRLRYENNVNGKMNREPDFPGGYITTDDSWINLWADGQNSNLGFRGAQSGNGGREFGMMIGRSRAFAVCMSKKVFKLICVKSPGDDDEAFINQMADGLENNSQYNMKSLFAKTAAKCVGDKHEN